MRPSDYSPVKPDSLPYLDLAALRGRPVPVHTFYDGEDWHLWVRASEAGLLQPMQCGGVVEGVYLANAPERTSDLRSQFLEFFDKHTVLPEAEPFLTAITNDLFNIAASLTKLQMVADAKFDRAKASRLALTEVEYLVIVCRSVFDLIQEVMHRFWQVVRKSDGKPLPTLPKKFAKVILSDNTPRTAAQVEERFCLSTALSHWYASQAAFFLCLRRSRDFIIHGPRPDEVIFVDGSTFLVRSRDGMFSECVDWQRCPLRTNALGPLNLAVSEWVTRTLQALATLPAAITTQVTPLPDYAPAHNLFLRSASLAVFLSVKRIVSEEPWADLR